MITWSASHSTRAPSKWRASLRMRTSLSTCRLSIRSVEVRPGFSNDCSTTHVRMKRKNGMIASTSAYRNGSDTRRWRLAVAPTRTASSSVKQMSLC